MKRDLHGEAVQRLFRRQPTEDERRRVERMLHNLAPDVRDDPGIFELLTLFGDFFFELDRRFNRAVAVAQEEARAACDSVYATAARRIAEARPELKVARRQSLIMMSIFGLIITALVYLALIGLLKTGWLAYPHLSSSEQEQLALGQMIQASGNPDAAIWAAEAVKSARDLNEIARFTEKLAQGDNALDELAELRQCRAKGVQILAYQGRWMCSFLMGNP
jgi:hypothetical protein